MNKNKIIISVVGLALVTGGVFWGLNKKNEVAQVEVKQEQDQGQEAEDDKVKEVSIDETEKETDDKDKKLDESKKEETKVEKENKKDTKVASSTTSNDSSNTSTSSSKRSSNDSKARTNTSSSKNSTKSSTNNSYKPSKKKPVVKYRPQRKPSKPKHTSGGVPGFSDDEIIHTGKKNSGERVDMDGDWNKQVGDM